ncbi:MAG: hypothetical protein Q8P82_00410 [bacterium]|nr:hypothetical protein [bacterium]
MAEKTLDALENFSYTSAAYACRAYAPDGGNAMSRKTTASADGNWRTVPVTADPARLRVLQDTADDIFRKMSTASTVEVRYASARPADSHNGYCVRARLGEREFSIATRFLGTLSPEDALFLGIPPSAPSSQPTRPTA